MAATSDKSLEAVEDRQVDNNKTIRQELATPTRQWEKKYYWQKSHMYIKPTVN